MPQIATTVDIRSRMEGLATLVDLPHELLKLFFSDNLSVK